MRCCGFLVLLGLLAGAPCGADEAPGRMLDFDGIEYLLSGNTAECRKEKDQSLCVNYFSDEGALVQVLRVDGERKEGAWFIDDSDRLCILWHGKIKPLCFHVYEQADGTYQLVRHERHITTILTVEDGNPQRL